MIALPCKYQAGSYSQILCILFKVNKNIFFTARLKVKRTGQYYVVFKNNLFLKQYLLVISLRILHQQKK